VGWIAAAGSGEQAKGSVPAVIRPHKEKHRQKLAGHDFPAKTADGESWGIHAVEVWQNDPDIWLYRKKTIALLRRYMQWSLEAGRVPSLLGRELFRAKISSYSATTFEARVIFLHDVERCLERMQSFDRQLIARVLLQEHDHEAAARMLQCTRKTLERRLPQLIDELSENLLRSDLMERLPETTEAQ
jgi:hypothetical protein